jgi:signal transduction histidine kinase/FixJ family two-component response regulator
MTSAEKEYFHAQEKKRKGKLLNLIVGLVAVFSVITIAISLYIYIKLPTYYPQQTLKLIIGASLMTVLSAALLFSNKYISNRFTGLFFALLFTVIIALTDSPKEVTNGRSTYVLLIPIFMASFVVKSYLSFFFAIISSIIISVMAVFIVEDIPNITTILGYFTFATLSWLSAKSLEDALKAAYVNNLATQRSERKYRKLFTNINSGYAFCKIIKKNGKPVDFIYLEVNDEFQIITDTIGKEIVGRKASEVYTPGSKTVKYWVDFFGEVALTQKEKTIEQYVEPADKWIQVRAYSPGKDTFVSIIDDITKSKKAQEDLLKAKNLAEKTKKTREQFIATLSHEIRNPLNAISGLNTLLHETDLSIEQAEYVNSMELTLKNLLVIVNDTLSLSKLDADKVSLRKNKFNLHDLINNLDEIMKATAAEKGIRYNSSITGDTPKILLGDPVRLNQILLNLLTNAMKFTKEGSVNLIISDISDKDSKSGELTLEFKVKDTGIGIPEDKLDYIFEMFAQVESPEESTKLSAGSNAEKGSGLGLAITKRLVEAQKGKISVKSQPDRGSTFTVEIPFEIPTKMGNGNHKMTRKILKENLKGTRVLLIEDDPINRKVISALLEKWGVDAVIVNNAEDGLERLRKLQPEIVIMDIQLPGMNGFEFAELIRNLEDAKMRKTPLIALTGNADEESMRKAWKSGFDDYISKPFEPEELQWKTAMLLKDVRKREEKETKSTSIPNDESDSKLHSAEKI